MRQTNNTYNNAKKTTGRNIANNGLIYEKIRRSLYKDTNIFMILPNGTKVDIDTRTLSISTLIEIVEKV